MPIIVVDDSPVFRPSAQALLERRGYEVVGTASSVTAALPLAKELRPTGALVDVLLPDGSGFDLVAGLERALPGIAVLVMSTHDHDGRAYALAESCGANGFVLKSQLAECDLESFLPPP